MIYIVVFICTLLISVLEELTGVVAGIWFLFLSITWYMVSVVLPYVIYHISWVRMKNLHGLERRKRIKYYAGDLINV